MLSKIVTAGTTSVRGTSGATAAPTQGRYFGHTLNAGAFTLTVHDSIGTASPAIGNLIDHTVNTTAGPIVKLLHGNGIPFTSGLNVVLTTAGTATVYYE